MELKTRWNGCDVFLHEGDITRLTVDAIVNAANSLLLAGGGVCGAIHRGAGPTLSEECRAIVARSGELPTGEAALTGAGHLPARHVIHAVGPFYDDDPVGSSKLLASAYQSALREARAAGDRSIAFPCISTGIYGYPPDDACPVAIGAVRNDLEQNGGLDKVVFCVFGAADCERYAKELAKN